MTTDKINLNLYSKKDRVQVTGSFDSKIQEYLATEYYGKKVLGYKNAYVKPYKGKRKDADCILVIPELNKEYTVEVKGEAYSRWSKYHQYGVEGEAIKEDKYISYGKVYYSKADIWLFYSVDNDYNYCMMEAYWFKGYEDKWEFVITVDTVHKWNKALNYDTMTYDNYKSSVYYVTPKRIQDLKVVL